MSFQKFPRDVDDVIRRYEAGERIEDIAAVFDMTGSSLRKGLRNRGYSLRSGAESMRLRMAALGPDGRQAQSAAAHAAVRGITRTADDLAKRAAGKERSQAHISENDRQLGRMLADAGLAITYAKAIGPYNADIATAGIVVECYGGGWHGGGRALARFDQRTRYILDAGWSVAVVWIDQRRHPLSVAASEYVVALADIAGRDPSAPRQYRVIRGTGEELVRGCSKDDNFPLKPPRKSSGCVRCEHDG